MRDNGLRARQKQRFKPTAGSHHACRLRRTCSFGLLDYGQCYLYMQLQIWIEELIMIRILVACLLAFYAINAIAADSSCSSQAAEKKLAGAAKTSFRGKCERDAKAKCAATAGEKKLAGAAKTSF